MDAGIPNGTGTRALTGVGRRRPPMVSARPVRPLAAQTAARHRDHGKEATMPMAAHNAAGRVRGKGADLILVRVPARVAARVALGVPQPALAMDPEPARRRATVPAVIGLTIPTVATVGHRGAPSAVIAVQQPGDVNRAPGVAANAHPSASKRLPGAVRSTLHPAPTSPAARVARVPGTARGHHATRRRMTRIVLSFEF